MEIGIFGTGGPGPNKVDALVGAIRAAHEDGFGSYWTAQIFEADALTAFAVAGREVPDIKLGTAVVPTYPRHPMMLAQQALTVQAAIGDRLLLGIGLSHQPVVEGMWGIPFERPVRHLREYLDALVPLVNDRTASVSGEMVTSRGPIDLGDAPACPVLVAALGEQTLKTVGKRCDGTITWMVGPGTLADHTIPVIREAAKEADRPQPQVVAGFPVCVTDDVEGARARAAEVFAIYGQLPSYRAMLDREGLGGPADLALIGDEATVGGQIDRLGELGVDTFLASEFATGDDAARTRDLLRSKI
ncbi:MAG: TIGR03564 family F420-dependent LLM class oxidoreductase [Actinomycetota bacterium]